MPWRIPHAYFQCAFSFCHRGAALLEQDLHLPQSHSDLSDLVTQSVLGAAGLLGGHCKLQYTEMKSYSQAEAQFSFPTDTQTTLQSQIHYKTTEMTISLEQVTYSTVL